MPKTSILLLGVTLTLIAGDWAQFRGPNGSGISPDGHVPVSWSESANIKWKADLPGMGSSSPVVAGDRVFLTAYSGYGLDPDNPGNIADLKRHVLCLDRMSGKTVWEKVIPAVMPEDPYQGWIRDHGYATNTPVTDGKHLFVYFGKSGVLAFDFKGNALWRTSVGTASSGQKWGSAPSPILFKDLVIVNVAEEGRAMIALNKFSGEMVWRTEDEALVLSYVTPAIVITKSGKPELVVAMPRQVWGMDPDSGKKKWWAATEMGGEMCPMPVVDDDIVCVIGGRSRRTGTESMAIRSGGSGDVSGSHILWRTEEAPYVVSPVLHHGLLYFIDDRGRMVCLDAKTGALIYKEALEGVQGRGPMYASLVLSNDHLYAVSRRFGTFVVKANGQFNVAAHNVIAGDDSRFNATPSVSGRQLFLRSEKVLYCIGE